eukprot:3257417-Amphidinium_carterae.1
MAETWSSGDTLDDQQHQYMYVDCQGKIFVVKMALWSNANTECHSRTNGERSPAKGTPSKPPVQPRRSAWLG